MVIASFSANAERLSVRLDAEGQFHWHVIPTAVRRTAQPEIVVGENGPRWTWSRKFFSSWQLSWDWS